MTSRTGDGSYVPYKGSPISTLPSQSEGRHVNHNEAAERQAAGVGYQPSYSSYSSQPPSYPSSDSSYSSNSHNYGHSSSSLRGNYRPPLYEGTARDRRQSGVGSTSSRDSTPVCNGYPTTTTHTTYIGRRWIPSYDNVHYRYRPAHGIGLAILFPIVLMACVPELLPFAVLLLGAGALAAITCCACKALGRQKSHDHFLDE